MYLFKSDLLVNQQKQRRTPLRISKCSWASKSIWFSKINFFVLSNQLSIDLRLYKLLLRKLKKKLLKLQIKTYVYIIPNNKLSHKSKNSRMGKGKGLNCRFYFRLKQNKPIIVFENLNSFRFLKIKQFLLKFFNYKFFAC